MFHMLSSFNLVAGVTIDDFKRALNAFDKRMTTEGLVENTGPVGRRQRHEIMDTDERDHEYFFIMSFKDRSQCDAAVARVYRHREPMESDHLGIQNMVQDPVFTCWQDLPG